MNSERRKRGAIGSVCATAMVVALMDGGTVCGAAETLWPAPVQGYKAPEPGEHPRLFFRKAQLADIRKRAETPDGKKIVARLRVLLNGSDGATLPAKFNETKAQGGYVAGADGSCATLWHPAGYGMLYHLTGDKKYAELGKQCMEKFLSGEARDRDARYAFVDANGALRAGPSLGAMAMGYDLCYDGWDEEFRANVASRISKGTEGGKAFPIEGLVKGDRLGVKSNHGGCQIGGGALAILAVWKDSGADNAAIEKLMAASQDAIIRQVTGGFGDGGSFWEGTGPGGIASDTALIPAIQAWYVAGGKDFFNPRPNVAGMFMLRVVQELVLVKNEPWYMIPVPSGYGTGYMGRTPGQNSDRDGLSKAAQYAQGFGVCPEKLKPVMLWTYNHIMEKDPATRSYDLLSVYPHRAVLALANWPIGMQETDPNTVLARVHWDTLHETYLFRNQWSGTEDDILVKAEFAARDPATFMIWGKGEKRNVGPCPKGKMTHFQPAEDGSGTLTAAGMQIGVDFGKTSGADALIVTAGTGATGGRTVDAGGTSFHVFLVGGKAPEPKVEGDKVVVGGQGFKSDGQKIIFDKMAPPQKRARFGLWK